MLRFPPLETNALWSLIFSKLSIETLRLVTINACGEHLLSTSFRVPDRRMNPRRFGILFSGKLETETRLPLF